MRNNSLNSTIIHNQNLNGTRNQTQQDNQTPSHFINEEIVQTTTTTQQSISPIHPNLTTPRNTNTSLAQVTLQSTVKPSVAPKYSHMDYQTYRPMTIPSKTRKPFTRNTFAEHNYNYGHKPRKNQPPRKNVCSLYWNLPKTSTNSVNFPDNPQPTQDYSENFSFFQQNKNNQHTPYNTNYLSSDEDDYHQPDIFAPYAKEYRTQRPRQSQPSRNIKVYPQNPTDVQSPQQMHIQNPFNTQSFQSIQPQNPM